MLVNLFKSKTPISIISLPLLIAGLSVNVFFSPAYDHTTVFDWQRYIYQWVMNSGWLNYLITIFIVSGTAHQLNNLFNRHNFFSKNTFLPGLLYVVGLATFDHLTYHNELVAHLFCVFALMYVFQLRRQEEAKAIMFKAGLFIGLAIVMSPLLLPFVLIPYIALGLFRPFVWREWLLLLIGTALPMIYLWVINFWVTGFYIIAYSPLTPEVNPLKLDELEVWTWVFFGGVIIYSIWKVLVISSTEVVRFKKQTQLLFHMVWVFGLSSAAEWIFFGQFLLGVLIPLMIICSVPMLNSRNSLVVNTVVGIWFIISGFILFI